MSTDIILSKPNNDITFSGNDLAFFVKDSPDFVAQRLEIKLRNDKGEWFLDINYGIPWMKSILSQGNKKSLADNYIRKTIIEDPAIKSITSYSSTLSKTVLTVKFTAKLITNELTTITLEV